MRDCDSLLPSSEGRVATEAASLLQDHTCRACRATCCVGYETGDLELKQGAKAKASALPQKVEAIAPAAMCAGEPR